MSFNKQPKGLFSLVYKILHINNFVNGLFFLTLIDSFMYLKTILLFFIEIRICFYVRYQSHYREVPRWCVSNGARLNWKCFLAYKKNWSVSLKFHIFLIHQNVSFHLRYCKVASTNASHFVTHLVFKHTQNDNFLI